MKVYCPCGKKCKQFSGSPRKCEHVSESSSMPRDFLDQVKSQAEGGGSRFITELFGTFGATVLEQAGGPKITYHVWRCPACKCRVLTQTVKNGSVTNEEEAGEISRCR